MGPKSSLVKCSFALALLWSMTGRADAEPLRVEVGATTLHGEGTTSEPGFTFGGSLGLARWSPFAGFALAPHVGVLIARRNGGLAGNTVGDGVAIANDATSFAADSLEIPLLVRGELTLAGRMVYVVGGVYGSRLLRAQRMADDGVVHRVNATSTDLGLMAGGGFELRSFAWGSLSVELRYQRGSRAFIPESGANHRVFSLLLGYGLKPGESGSPALTTESRAPARSLALQGGLVVSRLAPSSEPGTSPGWSLGAAFSPARIGSRLALVPAIELSLVHRGGAQDPLDGQGSVRLDHLESAALVRGELELAGPAVYGLAGLYGSVLLRAQHSFGDMITETRDGVHSVDAGWLAGAGAEFSATSTTRLSVELRYQRSFRDPLADGVAVGSSLAALVGIRRRAAPSPMPRAPSPDTGRDSILHTDESANTPMTGRGTTSVLIGRTGDRWLHTMRFARIERATHKGERGYQITYNIAGHGEMVLFWSRDRIDFKGRDPNYRRKTKKLGKGRLWYPTRITSRSLPRVHEGILELERAYAQQADGATTAMEGFAIVAGVGPAKPTLRRISPPPPSRATATRSHRTTASRTSSRNTANQIPTPGTTAAASSANAFGGLSRAAEFGIQPYKQMVKALKGTGLQAHHLIERRFAGAMGQRVPDMLSMAVTRAEHQAFTNAWRARIPYGRAGTGRATKEWILQEAREIYADYPAILRALGL